MKMNNNNNRQSFASRERKVRCCSGRHDARHVEHTYNVNARCNECTQLDALAVGAVLVADALLAAVLGE